MVGDLTSAIFLNAPWFLCFLEVLLPYDPLCSSVGFLVSSWLPTTRCVIITKEDGKLHFHAPSGEHVCIDIVGKTLIMEYKQKLGEKSPKAVPMNESGRMDFLCPIQKSSNFLKLLLAHDIDRWESWKGRLANGRLIPSGAVSAAGRILDFAPRSTHQL